MKEAIAQFHTQFAYVPEVVGLRGDYTSYVVGGMGGSHLAADILKAAYPDIRLSVWSDYGVPVISDTEAKETLFIASSHSGNTEEVLDFARTALQKGYAVAVVTQGGALLEFAEQNGLAYVKMPTTKLQPRSALGYATLALGALFGRLDMLADLHALQTLAPLSLEAVGRNLATDLRGKVPLFYAPRSHEAVAYNWKIKCNETGKIPAFYNVFPELNHNEFAGCDVISATRQLSASFAFVFLQFPLMHPQTAKRFDITKKLLEDRGFPVYTQKGSEGLRGMFESLLVADWTAFHLSALYGTEPERVPLIEELKKRL